MKGAGTDALRIVEEWEPYNGGKHSIRALHDLDILDKHRLIVPQVFFVATVASIPAQPAKLLAAEFLIIAGVSWTTQTILLLKYVKVRTGHPRAWLAYRVGLGQLATLPFCVAGLMLLLRSPTAVYWLVPGFVFSFVASMVSAWVLLVEIRR